VIKTMTMGKEVCVTVTNEIGALSRMTSFLVNHGINLEAIAGYSNNVGDQAGLMFLTNDNVGAIQELESNGYSDVRENEVIIVELENSPGALKNISERLAQNNVNISYIYCTSCAGSCPAKIVLATSDNNKAVEILKN